MPAEQPGRHQVKMANGGTFCASQDVILSTGARWRNVNVPGEAEYQNKGWPTCPHCDGPLFKGKRTAVIGGGNSGVEAAIDLAGIVARPLIELPTSSRPMPCWSTSSRACPIRPSTNAQTTEITGAEGKVNGLKYKDRATGEEHLVPLEGVFVQIGLVPNTEVLAWHGGVGASLAKS